MQQPKRTSEEAKRLICPFQLNNADFAFRFKDESSDHGKCMAELCMAWCEGYCLLIPSSQTLPQK
ncbi:hypothetical protein [Halodesulfovibrio spirochaetisodalis]|uniref:Uncharacterized protein n=1 Tax=Halodesulfovibrio spirochaetisodalis TaxID=1560234 RepID=A0A1B7X9U4_9BACT|nr:hypothetical protein [Halodesulfovibrio spirochaetisodalis]OBQ46118.1 hypothetical protein SP90_14630 [Halodesulfovibrio spirochaetisodalis]